MPDSILLKLIPIFLGLLVFYVTTRKFEIMYVTRVCDSHPISTGWCYLRCEVSRLFL